MKTTLQSLQESISNAVDMIDQSQLVSADLLLQQSTKYSTNSLDFTNANSLLDKCEQVNTGYKKTKPVIRIIHHLACSGGSLISKFLSSMSNTFLLSEIHPNTHFHLNPEKPHYAPTDLSSLIRFSGLPNDNELINNVFCSSIAQVNLHTDSLGGNLILRDHTHADFCVENCSMKSTLVDLLADSYDIRSVLTLRNPIDSYLSLVKNGWVHFLPVSFEEYCSRVCVMLAVYSDVPIFHYEELVASPLEEMKKMCEKLEIDFSENFIDIFDVFSVTGDSGRSDSNVASRSRRQLERYLSEEIMQSKSFEKLNAQFGFQ
jgi:hypothetical protein